LCYKPLNLNSSELLVCCNLCYKNPIDKIVKKKFDLRKDELVGHNYLNIKTLILKNCNMFIANYILKNIQKSEMQLVNTYIYITDPRTNNRRRFTKSIKMDYGMSKIIKKNQKFLIDKIFN
jgi:hypothetical protein